MAQCPSDPLQQGGIAGFGADLRAGRVTAVSVTRSYLDRIAALDGKLGAFQHVAGEQAMATADAIDRLLAAGVDLGPLMGVPVGIKDIYAVDGMPITNGSLYDASHITGGEGSFVKGLKRAGCVIIGKTKTVEFALGATGVSVARGTPWNPWDLATHRTPGGSSSGSGVATAAGLCAFAMGSDTGGSVRIPACLNGIFGHKTTIGLLPTDGVFPLSPTLDTLGPLTRSAADAAVFHATVTGEAVKPVWLRGLRLGRPTSFFFEGIDPEVLDCVEQALTALAAAGVEIVDVDIPDPSERDWMFPAIAPPELLAALGEEAFRQMQPNMDPVIAARAEMGLAVTGPMHAAAVARHHVQARLADDAMAGLDGWVAPTCPFTALPIDDFDDPDALARSMLASRISQPGNLFRLCAITTPVHRFGSALPVGLQVMCRNGDDARALAIAMAIEAHFGPPLQPDLSALHDGGS